MSRESRANKDRQQSASSIKYVKEQDPHLSYIQPTEICAPFIEPNVSLYASQRQDALRYSFHADKTFASNYNFNKF